MSDPRPDIEAEEREIALDYLSQLQERAARKNPGLTQLRAAKSISET